MASATSRVKANDQKPDAARAVTSVPPEANAAVSKVVLNCRVRFNAGKESGDQFTTVSTVPCAAEMMPTSTRLSELCTGEAPMVSAVGSVAIVFALVENVVGRKWLKQASLDPRATGSSGMAGLK